MPLANPIAIKCVGWQTAFCIPLFSQTAISASAIPPNRFQHFSYNRFLDTTTMLNRLLPNLKRILHQRSKLLAHGVLLGLLLIPNSVLAFSIRQSPESRGHSWTVIIALAGIGCLLKALRDRDLETIMFMLILCIAQLLIGGLLLARPYYEMITTGWVLLGLAVVELLGFAWIRLKK